MMVSANVVNKVMMKLKSIVFSVVIFTVLFALNGHAQGIRIPQGIEVTLSMPQQVFSATDDLTVLVSYTNITDKKIRMLKIGTALDGGLFNDILNISKGGEKIDYSGPYLKRLPPADSDYIVIQPRQTKTVSVDINKAYAVDEKGQYNLSPKLAQTRFRADNPLAAKKEPLTFSLEEDRPQVAAARTPNFSSCSSGRRSLLIAALDEAERISTIAATDLADAPLEMRSEAERYKRWFGSYSAGRYNRVSSNFNRILSATRNQVINFDCACLDVPANLQDRVIAYVFTNDAYRINICPVFWLLPNAGTDSRSGTIVHEISHFSIVAATNNNPAYPEIYGTSAALNLAFSNPVHAINNAENHEYFAENTPKFSMPKKKVFSPAPALLLLLND